MKSLFLTLITTLAVSTLTARAEEAPRPIPPAKIERATYPAWLEAISAPATPFFDFMFNWYEAQLASPLPKEVAADPEKLFVSVAKPLEETKKKEADSEVEECTTFGLESYAILDAPVDTVKDTILFRWGKPIGQESGTTYPNDTVFGYRMETASPEWGPGSFKTLTRKRSGGIAMPMNDVFSLLVRGNAQEGYILVGSFIAPIEGEPTTSTTYITMILLKPTAGGKTDYRVAGFLTGQSYALFGNCNDGNRGSYGFNASRIRGGQLDFIGMVKSLKDTGKIPERRPKP